MLCVVLVAAVFGLDAVAGADRVLPVWKWNRGVSRKYKLRIDREQNVRAENEFGTRLSMDAVIVLRCVGELGDRARMEMAFERLAIERHAGREHYRFDSEKKLRASVEKSVWASAGRAVMATNAQFRIESSGTISAVEGFDRTLGPILKQVNPADRREAFQIVGLFGGRGIKNLLSGWLGVLPEDPIGRGDTWTKKRRIDLGMGGEIERVENYVFDGLARDGALEISMRGDVSLADGGEFDLPEGEVVTEISESDFTTRTLFSLEEGAILEQVRKGELDLKIKVMRPESGEAGQITTARLRQRIEFGMVDGGEMADEED